MAKSSKNQIELYGTVGEIDPAYESFTASQVRKQVQAASASEPIEVLINSGGGSVIEANAIIDNLKDHPQGYRARIQGVAASAASFIALKADRTRITSDALFMMHNPHTVAVGDHNDLRHEAELLEKVHGQYVSLYAQRSGMPRAEIVRMMDAETWLTGEEAVEAGFADSLWGEEAAAPPKMAACFLMGGKFAYKHCPIKANEPEAEAPAQTIPFQRRDLSAFKRLTQGVST